MITKPANTADMPFIILLFFIQRYYLYEKQQDGSKRQ